MSAKNVSRRAFLRWAGLISGTAIMAACAPTPSASPTAAATAAAATEVPTANADATAAVQNAQATEDAIAAAAQQAADAQKVFSMTQDQFNAQMKQDEDAARAAGKTIVEMMSAFGTVIEDKTQPHYWIIKAFMEKNPNIFVKYTPSSAYTGAFDEAIMMRMASGDPPDCIYHYSSPIVYAANGTCMQLDDMMDADPVANKDAFEPAALAQVQWNGKTWGLVLNGSPDAMYYNTDVLQEAGLPTDRASMPKTWDQVKEWSAKVTKYDGDKVMMAGANPWSQNWTWPGQFAANGGGVWDGEKYSINHPKNIEVVEYWVKWLDDMYKGDIDKFNAQGNFSSAYPEAAFGMKLQAIINDGLWSVTHTPPEIKYEVAPMPTGPSGTPNGMPVATSNWPNLMFVPMGAKHPKEGFALSAYFATEGQYEWWDRWADYPVWKKFPTDRAPKDLVARVGQEKAMDISNFIRSQLPYVVVQWSSPVDNFATDEISRAVDQVMHKKASAKDVLDQAQQTVTAKLEETVNSK